MDNLDPIVVIKQRTAPVVATHDDTIQFDGDSRGRQVELADQFG